MSSSQQEEEGEGVKEEEGEEKEGCIREVEEELQSENDSREQ